MSLNDDVINFCMKRISDIAKTVRTSHNVMNVLCILTFVRHFKHIHLIYTVSSMNGCTIRCSCISFNSFMLQYKHWSNLSNIWWYISACIAFLDDRHSNFLFINATITIFYCNYIFSMHNQMKTVVPYDYLHPENNLLNHEGVLVVVFLSSVIHQPHTLLHYPSERPIKI